MRGLETVAIAPHRIGVGELVVNRGRLQVAAFGQELVRERDAETASVVFADLLVGERHGVEVAETGDVHSPDVVARVALGHPVRQCQSHAAALAEAGHDRGSRPVAGKTTDRPQARVAVGAEHERPVDDRLDAGLREDREVLETTFEVVREVLEVWCEQLHAEVPRRLLG